MHPGLVAASITYMMAHITDISKRIVIVIALNTDPVALFAFPLVVRGQVGAEIVLKGKHRR